MTMTPTNRRVVESHNGAALMSGREGDGTSHNTRFRHQPLREYDDEEGLTVLYKGIKCQLKWDIGIENNHLSCRIQRDNASLTNTDERREE